MKKQIISEINDIRRIMGLSLITEGRDDLIALMKKLSSETAAESEKTEIKSILKKMGATDDEIAQLVRGSERTLGELSRKLSGQFSQEISQEVEKLIIKSGAAAEAFRGISGESKRFVDKMDELYRAYKNNTISYDDYIKRKEFALDIYDQNFKRSELQRAIDSIEKSVDDDIERAFKEGTNTKKGDEVKTDVKNDDINNINPSIPSEEITDEIINDPDALLRQFFPEETLNKVKKEFKASTPKDIADQYDKWKNDKNLNPILKKKWDDFMPTIDKNRWERLSKRTRAIITIAVLLGPNSLYMLSKTGAFNSLNELFLLIPWLGIVLYEITEPSEKDKKIEDESKERVDAAKRLRNYIAIDTNTKKRVEIDAKKIYLDDIMDTFSNPSNDILKKVEEKINSEVELKKERLASPDGLYAVGAEIAAEINKILQTYNDTKKFNVEYLKFDDVDYDKPLLTKGVETITSLPKEVQEKLKTYLSIKSKNNNTNWNPNPNKNQSDQFKVKP